MATIVIPRAVAAEEAAPPWPLPRFPQQYRRKKASKEGEKKDAGKKDTGKKK